MDYETRSPLLTDSNLEKINYNNYTNKNQDYIYHSNICYKFFHHPCHCKCHCHYQYHNLHHNILNSRNNNINQTDIDLEQRYKLYPQRNKSLNNLLYSQNNNSLEDLKRKYYNIYNDNNNKNRNNQIYNNYKYKNNIYTNDNIKKLDKNYSSPNLIIKKNENSDNRNNYNNYSFKDIKIKNNNINNSKNNLEKNINNNIKNNKIKPSKSFQIKRKELSQYYHTSNPKKYSYGGDILETVNNADNHKYKEVIGTSNSKDKNINKSRVIYGSQNNNIDMNTNNNNNKYNNDDYSKIEVNNNYLNDRLKNHKYINYRYKSYQNSPKKISRNILYEPKETNTEIKKKILKETYNTRLVESKELKKSPTEKYLYNSNNDDDIKYRNNLNKLYNQKQISNGIKSDNDNNNYLYQKDNKYNINNKINIDYDYYKVNNYKMKNIPKSYSFNNLNHHNSYNLKNIKNNYNTEYENNFSYNDNQKNHNNKNNNNIIDYEMIKLKVKLALLRKQMYEQERERIFNNKKNEIIMNKDLQNKKYLEKFLSKGHIKPNIADNNNLFEKTKKLLEAKKLKNIKKELNNKIKQNNENKILYSLKKNLRDKNDIYKNDMIKPKLKMWKP